MRREQYIWGRSAGRAVRVLLSVASLLVPSGLLAQRTTVTDTILSGNGSPVSGTITLTPNIQFDSLGQPVYPRPITVPINAATGVFTVQLYPNDTSDPTGTYYTAEYRINSPTVKEIWVVPTSGSAVGLADVRIVTAPVMTSTAAPAAASFITKTTEGALMGEFSLGTLADNAVLAIDVAASVATPRAATYADIVATWASGACASGYLKFDGTCDNTAFDPSALSDITWGPGTDATITWTVDLTGTDSTTTYGSGYRSFSGCLNLGVGASDCQTLNNQFYLGSSASIAAASLDAGTGQQSLWFFRENGVRRMVNYYEPASGAKGLWILSYYDDMESPTPALTVDRSNGRVGIGAVVSAQDSLQIGADGIGGGLIFRGTGAAANGNRVWDNYDDSSMQFQSGSTNNYVSKITVAGRSNATAPGIQFTTRSTERARFVDATGDFLLGVTSDGGYYADIGKSGSTGTFRVYDQTATTGVTTSIIRAGAGQSTTDLWQVQDNTGTRQVWVDSAYRIHMLEGIWRTSTESTCDSTNRGRIVMVQGSTGVADTFRVCAKDASDNYAFIPLI